MGAPARYVSGYLMMDDQIEQDASHAWAEAYVEGLGWVGFDVTNGISPDERYVKIAHGLDYIDCTPTHGIVIGAASTADLVVSIQVQQ
jgi:transglutaminase-like putative cysteine protease